MNAWVEKQAPLFLEKNLNSNTINPEKHKQTNLELIKNSLRVYVWNFQGLLSSIDCKANPKNLIKIDNNASPEECEITKDDVEKLFDKLNPKYKLILKIHFLFGGLNPADIVELCLNDFKKVNAQFYFIHKNRSKTAKKGGKIFNVIHASLFDEISTFFETENLKLDNSMQRTKNYPIFFHWERKYDEDTKKDWFYLVNLEERTISDEFRYVIKQNKLNEKIIPKYIRQLAGTILGKTLPDKYRLIWTQHKQEIKTDPNYIKSTIPNLIEYYEIIAKALLLGNGFLHQLAEEKDLQKKVTKLEQDISTLTQTNVAETSALEARVTYLENFIKRLPHGIPEDEFKEIVPDPEDRDDKHLSPDDVY